MFIPYTLKKCNEKSICLVFLRDCSDAMFGYVRREAVVYQILTLCASWNMFTRTSLEDRPPSVLPFWHDVHQVKGRTEVLKDTLHHTFILLLGTKIYIKCGMYGNWSTAAMS